MKLAWDEPKRLANLDKHGLDFSQLSIDFFAHSIVISAKNNRLMAIGKLENKKIVVIFTRLGREALGIISMRRASQKERRLLR